MAWLSAVWAWLNRGECVGCLRRTVPLVGSFGARRRVCAYCEQCAPEYYADPTMVSVGRRA